MIADVFDVNVSFDWNGQAICFSAWDDEAYGCFTYVTTDLSLQIGCELRLAADGVEIALRKIVGWTPSRPLPGIERRVAELFVAPAAGFVPRTVPQALMVLVMWAEGALCPDHHAASCNR